MATGGGHTALALAPIVRSVTAYDVTEPMLRAARGVLVGGQRSELRRLLWEHRGRLRGPAWALMLVATWAPLMLPRGLARAKRWLARRER